MLRLCVPRVVDPTLVTSRVFASTSAIRFSASGGIGTSRSRMPKALARSCITFILSLEPASVGPFPHPATWVIHARSVAAPYVGSCSARRLRKMRSSELAVPTAAASAAVASPSTMSSYSGKYLGNIMRHSTVPQASVSVMWRCRHSPSSGKRKNNPPAMPQMCGCSTSEQESLANLGANKMPSVPMMPRLRSTPASSMPLQKLAALRVCSSCRMALNCAVTLSVTDTCSSPVPKCTLSGADSPFSVPTRGSRAIRARGRGRSCATRPRSLLRYRLSRVHALTVAGNQNRR